MLSLAYSPGYDARSFATKCLRKDEILTTCNVSNQRTPTTLVLLLAVILIIPTQTAVAKETTLTLTELRKERKMMAHRKRRIIFNNDGDDIGGHGASTPDGLLQLRTKALLGSQVDSIFYHSTFGMKVIFEDGAFNSIYEYPDTRGVASRNCKALIASYGKDALDVMIDYCRKHDLEIFYSNRMNDVHDFYFPEMLSAIKVRHPEYVIGHGDKNPEETLRLMRQGKKTNTGLNFGLKVIRNLTVDAMRQVCRNYDIDGLELDYFRSPSLFQSPVSPQEVELHNDMMREMRKMTEEEGLRRGRPILIAARGINDPQSSLKFGIDIETWLDEDLIDILMPIHLHRQQGPLKSFFELAHHYNVSAYPCLRANETRHTWRVCRGEAMSRFAEGADGITTFNQFDPTHQRWRELGDPEILRDLNRTYTCPYYLPVTVTEDPCGPLPLLVGADMATAPTNGKRRSRKLRVQVTSLTAQHDFQLDVNGKTIATSNVSPALTNLMQDVWLEYLPDPTIFNAGQNLVTAWISSNDHLKDQITELKAGTTVVPFSEKWQFATDPADTGVTKKWYTANFDDSQWKKVQPYNDQGWGPEIGKYDGYGWYRGKLPALPDNTTVKYLYLYFGAVDEQAWIYLNGKKIAEHTTESTGKSIHQLWEIPFIVDITRLVDRNRPNTLVVRVHNETRQGGIWRPTSLIVSDVKDMNPNLFARYQNGSLGVVQITAIELEVKVSN